MNSEEQAKNTSTGAESTGVDRGTLLRALGLLVALALIAWIVHRQSS